MHGNNVWEGIGYAVSGAISWLVMIGTNYHVMGILGFICILMSIRAWYLTIKEKNMSIKEMTESGVEEVKALHMLRRILKRKSGGKV